jgi:MFS family permease
VIFYSAYLLQNVLSLSRSLSLIVGGCTGLTFFVFTFIPILFIDRWGRRKPLMLGAAGQSISMLLIAVLVKYSVSDPVRYHAEGTAAVVFVMVYIATYSGFAWVATPWLYPTEITELRFRNQGTALATSANWLWNCSSPPSPHFPTSSYG